MNPLHDISYDDILNARAKTQGVYEYVTELKPELGGKISHKDRKKPRLCFVSILLLNQIFSF